MAGQANLSFLLKRLLTSDGQEVEAVGELSAEEARDIPRYYKGEPQADGKFIIKWDELKEDMPFFVQANIQQLLLQNHKIPPQLLTDLKDSPLVSADIQKKIIQVRRIVTDMILHPAKYDGQDLRQEIRPLVEVIQKDTLQLAKHSDGTYRDKLSADYYLENADAKNPNELSAKGKENTKAIVNSVLGYIEDNKKLLINQGYYLEMWFNVKTMDDIPRLGVVVQNGDVCKIDLSVFGIKDTFGFVSKDKLMTVVKQVQDQYENIIGAQVDLDKHIIPSHAEKARVFQEALKNAFEEHGNLKTFNPNHARGNTKQTPSALKMETDKILDKQSNPNKQIDYFPTH